MKHPALARVFSVVLAILGLILLYTGVKGFGKSDEEHAERLAYADKLAGNIENYRELSARMDRAADYRETMDALDSFLTAHEKSASQHKTDTATYTAAKGGIKMGEDMILGAKAEIANMRRELSDASSRRAFLQGMISMLLASEKDRFPWIDALAHQAAQYAVEAAMDSAELTVAATEIRALAATEPTPSSVAASLMGPPEPPAAPALPQLPDMAGASWEAAQAAYQSAMAAYQNAAAAYAQAGNVYAQQAQQYYDLQARAVMERVNLAQNHAAGVVTEGAYTAEYKLAHDQWEKQCREIRGGVSFLHYAAEIRRLSAALASVVRQANEATAFLTLDGSGMFPGLEALAIHAGYVAEDLERSGQDPAGLQNADFLRLADEAGATLDQLGGAFNVIAAKISDPSGLLLDLMDELEITEELVKYLDFMLERAEKQMEEALAELWYQLGEEEKKQLTLEAEKLELDEEAVILSKDIVEADELKELRNSHNTARQLLQNLPGVKEDAEKSGDLAGSAENYLRTYGEETGRIFHWKRAINLLAVGGGAMGLLVLPASYELTKKRFFLLAPVLLCLVCAAGAAGLCAYLGFDQQYAAMFTAIFALLHLLIVLPKSKRPVRAPLHLK